jgi:tRNA nucleotidyltransferase/poly(A) polymerase
MVLPTAPLQPLLRAHTRLIPALCRLSESASHEAYLVGGCIRDALLDRTIVDMDLAVAGDGLACARRLADAVRGSYVPLDETERTGRVVIRRRWTIDVTSLRGATLHEDLLCRDFTINVMACRLTDLLNGAPRLIDPLGGAEDLRRRRLAAVSERAFQDDPLRLLRAFRFAAQLDLEIDPQTRGWMRRWAARLPEASAERIQEELAALLMLPGTAPWLVRMWELGVLQAALPELLDVYPEGPADFALLSSMDRWLDRPDATGGDAIRKAVGARKDRPVAGRRTWIWVLRLSALLMGGRPEAAPPAAWIHGIATRRLRLSSREHRALRRMVRTARRMLELENAGSWDDALLYAIACEADEETPGVAALAWVSAQSTGRVSERLARGLKRLLRMDTRRQAIRKRPPLVTGTDLMAEFRLAPGPRLGLLLSRLEEQRILGGVATREEAFQAVRDWLAETPE